MVIADESAKKYILLIKEDADPATHSMNNQKKVVDRKQFPHIRRVNVNCRRIQDPTPRKRPTKMELSVALAWDLSSSSGDLEFLRGSTFSPQFGQVLAPPSTS
jgi:hypothetical protein